MRLTCPNCGAQYEVAEDVIPAHGRDVQCSNCGHTWIEKPGASEAAEAAIEDEAPATPVEADPDHVPWDDEEDEVASAPTPPKNRPALDASVAEILREEAERETAARRAEAPDPIESQDDLGLQDTSGPSTQEQRNIEAAKRIANVQSEAATPSENIAATTAAAAAAARKEVLPDIEEINSSLRSSADRGETIDPSPEEVVATKRRGFRFGFFLVLFILAALCAIYIFADEIGEMVPSLQDTLSNYVVLVDKGRVWIDLKVQELTASMEASPVDAAADTDAEG